MLREDESGRARLCVSGLVSRLDWLIRLSSPFATNFAALFLVLAFVGSCSRMEAQLKPGDMAPDFSLTGSDGRIYSLSDFRGKKVVVLAWFPKAFTGG